MIIVSLFGGLGNQMFQYAAGLALAKKLNRKVFFNENFNSVFKKQYKNLDLNKIFNLQLNKCSDKFLNDNLNFYLRNNIIKKIFYRFKFLQFLVSNFISEKNFKIKKLKKMKFIYLHGYFQNQMYFHNYTNHIIKTFKKINFKNDYKLSKIYKFIKIQNSVSVHVRRGDFLTNKININYNKDYYLSAIRILEKTIKKTYYFFFTDDVEWVKKNLQNYVKKNSIIVSSYKFSTPEIDLFLMSKCKNNIITNSTFSWWGTKLNSNKNKLVIAPKKWFKKKQKYISLEDKKWIRV